MTDVSVRTAGAADWRAFRNVRLRALEDAPHAFESTLERERLFGQRQWDERIRGGTWFLAEADGEVVGMAGAIEQDHYGPSVRHLISMWVDPRWRGTGAADRLVQAVCQRAREAGATTVTLWVIAGNVPAERLYQRNGFRRSGEAKPLSRDRSREEFRMVRVLD
jgi:RimJ/RimL family protein N-acetyltransferase